jgi:hypothetical protein
MDLTDLLSHVVRALHINWNEVIRRAGSALND